MSTRMGLPAPPKHTGGGASEEAKFLHNLAQQEPRRWAEYLQRGTREALDAWRSVRGQLRRAQKREATNR